MNDIAVANLVCLLVGSVLFGFAFGPLVGFGTLFLGWALLTPVHS